MTLLRLSAGLPITTASGRASAYLLGWIADLITAVNALAAQDARAAPAERTVAAAGGLHGGGSLEADIGLTLYRAVGPLAQLPVNGNAPGDWAFASDGRKPGEASGAGTGVPVFWSHTAWFSISGSEVQT